MLTDSIEEHLRLIERIDATYKNCKYKECEKLCILDIELFPQYAVDFGSWEVPPRRYVSFETLIKVYDKQGRINEAIDVCEIAISYGIGDGTKGGFASRLEKLKKKLQAKK